jgi:hypothetical protein
MLMSVAGKDGTFQFSKMRRIYGIVINYMYSLMNSEISFLGECGILIRQVLGGIFGVVKCFNKVDLFYIQSRRM